MKPLLRHLTKFVETALELYAPLPFDFTADLHTLNAYLRSYSEAEEKLLGGFVSRLAEKLEEKTRMAVKEQPLLTNASENFDNVLRHYNSCTFKYPELRLDLDATEELHLTGHIQDKPVYSQRSGRGEEAGIKGNRHKFGSRHRCKLNGDASFDKENLSFDKENHSFAFNVDRSQDKTLKGIKSEMELTGLDGRKKSADVSLKVNREESKKARYESNESRTSNTSSLKIKLKPRPTIDLHRLRQSLGSALEIFSRQEQQITELMCSLLPGDDIPAY